MIVVQRLPTFLAAMLLTLMSVGGCTRRASQNSNEKGAAEDATVWLDEGLDFEGMTIAFGHRGQLEAGDGLEPAVAITKDGKPVADAMVFYQLVSSDGQTTLGDELATVFEPASAGKPACYAEAKLRLPAEVGAVAVRVRIVRLDIDKEWTKDFIVGQLSDATIPR